MSDVILEIYGFKMKPDTLYQITEKLDSSAPEGFREFKTSKILHPDITNSEPGAVFDLDLGIWDNGLYENSKGLRRAIPVAEERVKFLKDVTKYIVKPLEDLKGKNFLSQFTENNTFWDKYRVEIGKDRVFNTGNPEEFLQLYLSILHRHLTPKELESNPSFKNSQYCIVDKESSIDRKLEKEYGMMEANSTFFTLLKGAKKDDLFILLDYLRIPMSPKTEDRILVNQFNNWLNHKTDGYQNYSVFLKTYKFFRTEEGEKEVFYHSKLKDLIKTGVIKQKQKEIWFEDEFMGSDLKAAAKNIMGSKDLEIRFLKHLE